MEAYTTKFNETHIAFDGIPFNLSTLNAFNLTIYPNGTVSNSSRCWLAHDIYRPVLLPNGTFLFADKCDAPINPIATRGGLGIAFAVLFGLALVFVLQALKKHGSSYLPLSKRFRLVGRRWPWYWAIITCAVAIIAGITSIDVDRAYVPRLGPAITLTNLFYSFMTPCALGMLWELIRNWHTFRERLLLDADEFHFPPDDARSKTEFFMPMIIYLWIFLSFFLSILRDWAPIKKQIPSAIVDARFKAGSLLALIAILNMLIALVLAVRWYRPPGPMFGIPWKIPVVTALIFVRIAYQIAAAWWFDGSPMRIGTDEGYIYGLGYAPVWLAIVAMIVAAWREGNEDKIILEERKKRDAVQMEELRGMERSRREELRKNRAVDGDEEAMVGLKPMPRAMVGSGQSVVSSLGGDEKERRPRVVVDSMIDGATVVGPSSPRVPPPAATRAGGGMPIEATRTRSGEEDPLMQPN